MSRDAHVLGSARVTRAGFGIVPKRSFVEVQRPSACRAFNEKFAMAECHRQHAASVRSPII
jgi:hypothetical protein